MTDPKDALAPSGMTTTRPGASRSLLNRKSVERGARGTSPSETIEDSFPQTAPEMPRQDTIGGAAQLETDISFIAPRLPAQAPAVAFALTRPALGPVVPSAPVTWSDEEETTFQSLGARRRAAGYKSRGLDVGGQTIGLGRIKPNPDTVVAVIAAIIAERGGTIARAELVSAMATATFPHPKAQPTDRSWCQGYIAGAVRNGFLTSATATPAQQTEAA